MFAEVLPFNKDEYIARQARLGMGYVTKPTTPKQVVQVAAQRQIVVSIPTPPPVVDPSIIPSLDKTMLVPADQWKIIFQEVCEKHGVPPILIRGKQRAKYIVAARQELAYRLSQETTMSLPQIASKMGYQDHTTPIYSIKQHKKRMEAQRVANI